MSKYRVFVRDVGKRGYSGLRDAEADSVAEAIIIASRKRRRLPRLPYLIALPHDRKDLWPDGKTGKVSPEALEFQTEN